MHRCDFADANLNLILLRLEFPRQAGCYVRIETNGERAAENVIGRPFGNLGSTTKTGRLAEPGIERDRRIGRTNHAGDKRAAARGDEDVAPQRFFFGDGGWVRSLRFVQIGRIRTPGPFTNVMA